MLHYEIFSCVSTHSLILHYASLCDFHLCENIRTNWSFAMQQKHHGKSFQVHARTIDAWGTSPTRNPSQMCGAVVSDMNPFQMGQTFSHWMYQNTWKIPHEVFEFIGVQSEEWLNSKIFAKHRTCGIGRPSCFSKSGLVCLSHHIWYHKNIHPCDSKLT